MFIYWVIFLILATGSLLEEEEDAGRMRLFLILFAAVPVVLMIGLRWRIGPDWPAYASIYRYSTLYSFAQTLGQDDPGFRVLCWSLKELRAPFWILNFLCGTIFVGGLTAFCRRQPNPWLAYLVALPYLIIVAAMSGERQSVALGLLFFSLCAFQRGQLYRFVALIMVAALFHGSVLLMLPICLLSYTRNRNQAALLLLMTVGLGAYFLQGTFGEYARRYSMASIQSTGTVYRLAMNSLAAIVFLLFRRRFELDDREDKLWRNISICTLALMPLLAYSPSSTAIDRFLLYLFPLQFVVFNRLPNAVSADRQMAVLLTFPIIAYAAVVQITFLSFGAYSKYYVPYRSIFDPQYVAYQ